MIKIEHKYKLNQIETTAQWLLNEIGNNKVVALSGNMGTGKTTLVNAICKQLGVNDTTSSPTFSIINEYRYHQQDGVERRVYHIDLYRLKNEQEAVHAGVEDCIYSGEYCFVEWPEKASGLFPEETVFVQIKQIEPESRLIEIIQE